MKISQNFVAFSEYMNFILPGAGGGGDGASESKNEGIEFTVVVCCWNAGARLLVGTSSKSPSLSLSLQKY